jgi:hypothetical protein
MGQRPEDTQHEIARLRGDMSAAIAEVERRVRGGVRGVTSTEARITSSRTREELASKARENPRILGVAGVVAAAAVGYGVYAMVNGLRERQKPQNRLRRGVKTVRGRAEKRVGESRKRLEEVRQRGVLVKLEPEDGGYMRLTDARLDLAPLKNKKRGQTTVIKKLVWAGLLSVFMAVSSVLARRVAMQVWRAAVHEDPPTEKQKASSS